MKIEIKIRASDSAESIRRKTAAVHALMVGAGDYRLTEELASQADEPEVSVLQRCLNEEATVCMNSVREARKQGIKVS